MIDFDISSICLDRPGFVSPHAVGHGAFGLSRHAADVLRRTVETVAIGETRYRLRNPVTLTFYPYIADGAGELIQESGLTDFEGLYFTGRGTSFQDAFDDWSMRLHAQVQALLAKRPWEMSEEERRELASVERMIDLPTYYRETPYSFRQIGTVTRRRPLPDRIQWEDGLTEHVNLHQMPADFAAFQAGQRFEAITVRDSVTGDLKKVVYVGRLDRLATVPADRWETTQTFQAAPEGSWEEIG